MSELRTALCAYFLLMDLLLFAFMGADKRKAQRKAWRIPERALFTLAALGGGAGGILGMVLFRHKTKHISFVLGFPVLTALNAVLAYFLLKYFA